MLFGKDITCVPYAYVFIYIYCFLFSTGGERLIASTCFKNPNKTLNISCPADQLIFIHRSFYGYSHTGSCQYRSGDCTMVQQEQYRCVGQHNCDINLPSSDHGRYIDSCKESSTYFQVEYECIPGKE